MYYYLVFFSNRRTAKVTYSKNLTEAKKEARRTKKMNYGRITSARKATPAEAARAKAGKWVMTKTPASARRRGLGPRPKKFKT